MPKFINQKCVHCLRFYQYLTEDHILPESWYPKNTPPNIEKWVVPACERCNENLGKLEEDLLLRLGMCVEDSDFFASGINNKVMRMIKPQTAHDRESYNRKISALLKVIDQMKPCPGDHESVLKNLNHWHGAKGGRAIRIPQKELVPFIKKMARGLEFKLRGKLIEIGRKIIAYRPTQNNPDDDKLFKKFERRISSCLKTATCGHGFIVNYGVNPYNEGNVIYKILIWNKFELWTQIIPNNMIRNRSK